MSRVVFVCSPYCGDVERNVGYARRALRDALMRNETPIAPHLLYPQPGVLRDEIEAERALGMCAGERLLMRCDVLVVYEDYGESSGMRQEIAIAAFYEIPVERRRLGIKEPS